MPDFVLLFDDCNGGKKVDIPWLVQAFRMRNPRGLLFGFGKLEVNGVHRDTHVYKLILSVINTLVKLINNS